MNIFIAIITNIDIQAYHLDTFMLYFAYIIFTLEFNYLSGETSEFIISV